MCILVVEDEPVTRLMLMEALAHAGHEAVAAEDGLAALDALDMHTSRFSGLVADYTMPVQTGKQVVEHMRSIYPEVPMIITTAAPDRVEPDFQAQHRVHVVGKPYEMKMILDLLASPPGATRHLP